MERRRRERKEGGKKPLLQFHASHHGRDEAVLIRKTDDKENGWCEIDGAERHSIKFGAASE